MVTIMCFFAFAVLYENIINDFGFLTSDQKKQDDNLPNKG